jgi:hypothetical protein
MALPLAAGLAVLLALQASAQPVVKDPKAIKAELTQGFAKGTDLAGLDVSGQAAPLVQLYDQAKYVQAGREPGDEQETYITFIRSVARRLGTRSDLAVELYGNRVRPARAVAAAQRELDARAAVALDVTRNPGISDAKKKRLARDLRATSEVLMRGANADSFLADGPQYRPAELNVTIPDSLPSKAPAAGAPAYLPNGERNWSSLPPQVQPYPNAANPTPAPSGPLQSASAGMMSWASLTAYFDWEKGKEVAYEAYTGTLNYAKKMGSMCYRFFKQALIDAGVIDAPNPQSTGLVGLRPGAARMFSQDVKKNPKILDEMGYRQVDLANASNEPASVPDGSLLIYAGGCSFADASAGHAEITVGEETYTTLRSKNPKLRALPVDANALRVCHFSCTTRSMPFLRTYGKQGCLKMYVPVKSS